MLDPFAGRFAVVAAAMLFQSGPQIPPPRGLVNDFANVLPAASAARIERIAQDVRDKSQGEIAVVTLSDLGGREPSEVALRIGREWKVGNLAEIGDRSRNAGVVILIVPKETASDGRGRCRIETGQGSEGFITDAMSGEICREATPAFARRDYGAGTELVTLRVAQRFAQEFGFALDTALRIPEYAPQRRPRASGAVAGSTRSCCSSSCSSCCRCSGGGTAAAAASRSSSRSGGGGGGVAAVDGAAAASAGAAGVGSADSVAEAGSVVVAAAPTGECTWRR